MRSPRISALLALSVLGAGSLGAQPVRLATTAFGTTAEVEVRDLPRAEAEAAARAALEEIFALGSLADPEAGSPGGVGALNAAAGHGPQPLAESVAELLFQGLRICLWSSGAHGPLGGELYRLWFEDGRRAPEPADLRAAVAGAGCSRLGLAGGDRPTAEIRAGSRVDPLWMARGFAIDRAMGRLEERGVRNAWLEIGPVYRALGGGPDGDGWLITLPPPPGDREPLDRIWLQDQALAVAVKAPAGGDQPALIDQRTGVPARGVVMVVAVTGQAMDAEALAASLFILGQRDGQMRLSSFRPRPSIFWLLGDGSGAPLASTYHWAELGRIPRRQE